MKYIRSSYSRSGV